MLAKTRGIVIRNTNYSENSVVSKIFTSDFGLQSYLINGVRNNKGAIKASAIQPLSILDLEIYHKPGGNLQRIKEAKNDPLLIHWRSDIIKNCLAMFVAEVLGKTIHEDEPNYSLFEFLEYFIVKIETVDGNLALVPHYFLVNLFRNMGVLPLLQQGNSITLDLEQGYMVAENQAGYNSLSETENLLLNQVLNADFEKLTAISSSRQVRNDLLHKLGVYSKIHISPHITFNSVPILHQVLNASKNGTPIANN